MAPIEVTKKEVIAYFDYSAPPLEESKEKPQLASGLLKLDAFLNENVIEDLL